MAIKQTVHCDITDKEMDPEDIQRMTVANIVFKKVGKIKNPAGKEIECILEVQNYELHICDGKAAEFMEGLKELLQKMRK